MWVVEVLQAAFDRNSKYYNHWIRALLCNRHYPELLQKGVKKMPKWKQKVREGQIDEAVRVDIAKVEI